MTRKGVGKNYCCEKVLGSILAAQKQRNVMVWSKAGKREVLVTVPRQVLQQQAVSEG